MREPRATRRLFFALQPNSEVIKAINRATRSAVVRSEGRAVRDENLHITVAFLGNVDEERQARAAHAPPVAIEPFDLEFGRLGFWPRGRILWLEPFTVPVNLSKLEQGLRSYLADLGFSLETRPYRPHVTLARKAQAVTGDTPAVRWRVRQLALVESVQIAGGVRYMPLQSWPLQP